LDWIEIRANGWCTEGNYKSWVRSDAIKLKGLHKKGAMQYLLVTSMEDGKQEAKDWKEWFEGECPEVTFNPDLFGSFYSTKFREERKRFEGYYTVCLLQVI